MSQINQYPIEANQVKNEDFFDIDKQTAAVPVPVFESQKVTWGTIKSQLETDLPQINQNLSTANLTQTANTRTYDMDSKSLNWENVENMGVVLAGTGVGGNATRYNPNVGTTPPPQGNGARLETEIVGGSFIKQSWITTGSRAYRHLPAVSGGTQGCFWFGDHTSVGLYSGFQPNPNYHTVFASQDKATLFTDVNFASGENPVKDSVAWFRSNSKGVLFPNLTTAQRNAIPTPRLGLVIYNTTTNDLQVYNGSGGTGWKTL